MQREEHQLTQGSIFQSLATFAVPVLLEYAAPGRTP